MGKFEEEAPQDIHVAERITPPSRDLMEALRATFTVYLPAKAHAAVVADEVAEQRGEQRVLAYLQNILDAQERK